MNENYYEVFQKRSKGHGKNFPALVRNQAKHDFYQFLQTSPNTVEVKINNKITALMATLNHKKNDTLFKRFFLCALEQEVKIGDFLYWEDSIWLVFKKERDTIGAYQKFECWECKHTIQWIGEFGVLQTAPCYLVAQTDEKVKSNFRTWNNMITPQPNKFMEIITARENVKLGQKFLIDGTAWFVVESDYISVKNILYLSLTEDKVDVYSDDLENNIADIIDLNKFKVSVQDTEMELAIGNTYQCDGRIYLNGNFYSDDIIVQIIEGKKYISIDENLVITGVKEGKSIIRVSMEEDPEVYTDIVFYVSEIDIPVVTYSIEGDSSLKWGRTKNYKILEITNGIPVVTPGTFTIENNDNLVTYEIISNSEINVTANTENKIGTILIKVVLDNNIEIEKPVNITSLWM